MFDLKWIRENPSEFDKGMARRGLEPVATSILEMDEKRRAHLTKLQTAQGRRNEASKLIGAAKASGNEDEAQALMKEVGEIKTFLSEAEDIERKMDEEINSVLSSLPNLPHDDTPTGTSEDDNVEIRKWGEIPKFDFDPIEHFVMGENLGLMDFEVAAKISGARFVVLKGALSKLERSLANFMLDLHTEEFGYTEAVPPLLVRDEAMFGTAQLPKFADDQFRTENGYWLVPTAEVPLTNLVRESMLKQSDLPLRYTAHTPCFRQEAGAAGRDTRGMIRQHQFSKVELVSITEPEHSLEELERLVSCAEEVLKRLEIPYRTVTLCDGDMGFGARKTYDIEVWLPGQDRYREISSCSVCGDFQARRMKTRYKTSEGETRFVHTLNGSGLAVGRTLIAVMENYQQADGSLKVPDVLIDRMGTDLILPPSGG